MTNLEILMQHPALFWLVAVAWALNLVMTACVAALPAPTEQSSAKYIWWFKFLNSVVGNLHRARNTAVEQSPNWQAAVEKEIQRRADTYKQQNNVNTDPVIASVSTPKGA